MYFYSASLRRARFLMANSSWTKNHVDSVLSHRDGFLDLLNVACSIAMPISLLRLFGPRTSPPKSAAIVYPPCETQELVGFDLKGRERIILSVAQFRCVNVDQFSRIHQVFTFGMAKSGLTPANETLMLLGCWGPCDQSCVLGLASRLTDPVPLATVRTRVIRPATETT